MKTNFATRFRCTICRLVAAIFVGVCFVSTADADIVTFPLRIEFSGGDVPGGTPPWLIATFDDENTAGTVNLTLEASGLIDSEFVTEWDFNLDPSLDPSALSFVVDTKVGTFADPVISTGVDAFMADGDGRFDIEFLFDNAPPGNRFGAGESITYLISGIPTLTAGSFNFLSTDDGGQGPFPTAAHIQGIGMDAEGSGWITVPEPSSLAVSFAGLLTLLGAAPWQRARRKRA